MWGAGVPFGPPPFASTPPGQSHLPHQDNQMSKPPRFGLRTLAGAAIVVTASIAACGGGHHLAEYPFSSRTLAVVYIAPPAPVLLTSYYDLRSSQNAVEAVVRAGADAVKEREGRRASARLDSATARHHLTAV